MKNPRIPVLVLLTCVFAAFVLGFFAGRNLGRAPVQIQSIPPVSPQVTQTNETGSATEPSEKSAVTAENQPALVNINTAAAPELQTLPGIGEVIAQRIIDYREENGPFRSPGELAKVKGIGEMKLEEIWDLVTIGG